MKAGKNTPESVLRYIDAVWAANVPRDPIKLARELGYGPKGIRKLREKHGDRLLAYLEKLLRQRTEQPRFMAAQQGQLHPLQYVSSAEGAIDDSEAPDPAEIKDYRDSRELRERYQREKAEDAGELLGAMQELRGAIDAMNPEVKRRISRSLWVLRSRLDSAERQLRRDIAA
jgi:hypothetical protein